MVGLEPVVAEVDGEAGEAVGFGWEGEIDFHRDKK